MILARIFPAGFFRIVLRSALCGVLLAVSAHVAAQTPKAPKAEVKVAVDEVLALLDRQGVDPKERRRQLRALLAPRFDFEAMSRSVLAANWKKATPEQQQRFVALFEQLLGSAYLTAVEEYSGQTVRLGRERIEGERASVETFITRPSGGDVPVSYRLRVREGRWKAYDVSVEGVSLVSNYRSSFRSVIRKKGMDGLLADLEKKFSAPN